MKASVSQLEGVALAIAAFTCFVLADTSIKVLGNAKLPPFEVIAAIGCGEFVLLLLLYAVLGKATLLRPRRVKAQIVRSCLDLTNNLCVVIALRHVPLALFYILVFLAPAVTAGLSALVLRSALGWKRSVAVLTGFLGVLVAVNPFASTQRGDRTGYICCFICVACFSVSMVWSQRLTKTESPESLALFSGGAMAVAGSLLMLPHVEAISARNVGVLALTAVFSVGGSLCFFTALKHTSATTVSQYHYTQLLTGALLAYVIWREKPTVAMWIGAVLIVFSGWLAASIAKENGVVPVAPL